MYEVAILLMGSSQALWNAAFFWLGYSALEPYVRRLWPQVLISWTRLVAGRWRDPLVGQNVLLGILAGVAFTVATQLGVMLPAWFGLTPQPFIGSHPLMLDGHLALGGCIASSMIGATTGPLYGLMFLLLFRIVLRRPVLVCCAYIAFFTMVFTLLREAHPVIGWFTVGASVSLTLWVYLRVGFLAAIVMGLTSGVLTRAPLTTDFSAWYAGNGFVVIALFLALAAFGFYTSQAGRPIFQEELSARPVR
jgi:hypothetical protein